jgi:hypothetical protein
MDPGRVGAVTCDRCWAELVVVSGPGGLALVWPQCGRSADDRLFEGYWPWNRRSGTDTAPGSPPGVAFILWPLGAAGAAAAVQIG